MTPIHFFRFKLFSSDFPKNEFPDFPRVIWFVTKNGSKCRICYPFFLFWSIVSCRSYATNKIRNFVLFWKSSFWIRSALSDSLSEMDQKFEKLIPTFDIEFSRNWIFSRKNGGLFRKNSISWKFNVKGRNQFFRFLIHFRQRIR